MPDWTNEQVRNLQEENDRLLESRVEEKPKRKRRTKAEMAQAQLTVTDGLITSSVEEANQISELVAATPVEDQETLESLVDLLRTSLDEKDKLDAHRTQEGKVYFDPWKAVNDTYKHCTQAYADAADQIKAKLLETYLEQSRLVDEAAKAGLEIPKTLDCLLPGLTFKSYPKYEINLALLPDEFKITVADMGKIQNEIEPVPGVTISGWETKVSFRR